MRRALTLSIQTPIALDSLVSVMNEYAAEPVIHNKDQDGNNQPIRLLVGCLDEWEQPDIDRLIDQLKMNDLEVEVVK